MRYSSSVLGRYFKYSVYKIRINIILEVVRDGILRLPAQSNELIDSQLLLFGIILLNDVITV